jgi:hypothetical protein
MYLDELDRIRDHSRVWITREGKHIPVYLLKDDHLQNIERWLRYEGETEPERALATFFWYPVMWREIQRRGLTYLDPIVKEYHA